MPNSWSHIGKVLLTVFVMTAMTYTVIVFSSPRASATTPSQACGTSSISDICVSSWSTGITASFTNDTALVQYLYWIENGSNTIENEQVTCNGSDFSVFVPLAPGTVSGYVSFNPGFSGHEYEFTFSGLVVGGTNTVPPPPTSCMPPSPPSQNGTINPPVVGMSSTPDGGGYWLVGSNGSVQAHGDASWQGDLSSLALNKPIVGMAPTADGKGYWLDASDGGIFAFGDAQFYGSMGGSHLNQPNGQYGRYARWQRLLDGSS